MPKMPSKQRRELRRKIYAPPETDESADAAASSETPLEYMLRVMRDQTASPRRRDNAARAALRHLPADPGSLVKPLDAQPPLSRTEIARRVAALLAGADDKPATD